jgi:hypothetical protein
VEPLSFSATRFFLFSSIAGYTEKNNNSIPFTGCTHLILASDSDAI